jgi:hypothetical protein
VDQQFATLIVELQDDAVGLDIVHLPSLEARTLGSLVELPSPFSTTAVISLPFRG